MIVQYFFPGRCKHIKRALYIINCNNAFQCRYIGGVYLLGFNQMLYTCQQFIGCAYISIQAGACKVAPHAPLATRKSAGKHHCFPACARGKRKHLPHYAVPLLGTKRSGICYPKMPHNIMLLATKVNGKAHIAIAMFNLHDITARR